MSYETLLYEVSGGVGTITLNRPDKLNAFTDAMHNEFLDALKKAEKDPAVRCLVITGAGRGFCAGADLQEAGKRQIGSLLRKFYNVWITKLRTMEKPVIAAVNGVAAGAGVSLALAADLVLCSDKASFVQAFVKIGLVPDAGSSFFLPNLVGYHKAMELALFGDKVSAEEAFRIGLCNRVIPEAEFGKVVSEWAARLAAGPRSMGLIKRQFSRGVYQSLEETLELEVYGQTAAAASKDAKEGIQSFLEKRAPNFTGE